MARLLRLVRERELYRSLGFVRLGDYVVERVGMSYRTAQELIRVDAVLERLPITAAAFDAGEITSEQIRLLTRVASPENEAFWVGLARRSSVRTLARAVAGERRARDQAPLVPTEESDAAGGAGTPLTAAGAVSPNEGELKRLEIAAPAWVVAFWRDTTALVRRLAGSALPPGACFEMVLAEAADEIPACDDEGGESPGEVQSSKITSTPEADGILAVEGDRPEIGRLHASAREASEGPADSGREGLDAAIGPMSGTDAQAVDRELRRLNTEVQRRDASLAEHLRLVALDRGYRHLGHASLEEYAAERFGLSARTLYNLLALGRALARLPELRRAFVTGRLTSRQSVLVGGVASRLTVEAWVRRAESVTLRQLENEVTAWRHLKETRPSVWVLLDGGPLPEGLGLVPGQPPRLQASALPTPGLSPADTTRSGPAGGSPVPAARVSAEQFLEALAADEGATPLPKRLCIIRLFVEPEIQGMWSAALAHLRSAGRPDLREWEALALLLQRFWSVWDNSETRRQRRENPTADRDGWRCTAPACRSVGTGRLHEHHVQPRSAGGTDDPSNTTTLCVPHHLGLLHGGKVRCSGRAPDGLIWELGVEPGREPFLVYAGDRRIGGAAG